MPDPSASHPGASGQEPGSAPAGAPDWRALRELFPATREGIYLNSATYGPGPEPVTAAVAAHLWDWSRGEDRWRDWEALGEETRGSFARLIGARPEQVALLPTVSAAAGVVAEAVRRGPPAKVVVGEGEFRSNLFAWLQLEESGHRVQAVPFREGRLVLEDLLAAIDGETSLVALSRVQSSNGQKLDLEPIVAACRSVGARLFVDATQAVGVLHTPLEGVDYLATTAYKWLLSPRGSAFLHVAEGRLDGLPILAPGWKSVADPYATYYGGPFEPAPDASRLDLSLAWPVWVGTRAALELIESIGIEAIEARALGLARSFAQGLEPLGLEAQLPPAERSQIVALEVPDPTRLQAELDRAGLRAAVRDRYLRLAFHFFNDESDVERTLEMLGRVAG